MRLSGARYRWTGQNSDTSSLIVSSPTFRLADITYTLIVSNKKVHLAFLWVHLQSTAVEVDCGLEVLWIAIATHTAFDGVDFAVDALGYTMGNLVMTVANNIL
jgi:hypothetical protein